MLGKKKYTQAELDAAVAVGKRAAELDAQNAAETAERSAIIARVLGMLKATRQVPPSVQFALSWQDADGTVHNRSVDLNSLWAVMFELEIRGWRP